MKGLEERNASAETVKRRTARARETKKARNEETINTMERERHIMRDNAKSLLAEMKYWREAASSLANTGVRTCASARTLLTRVILASVTRSRAGIPTAIWRMARHFGKLLLLRVSY